MAWKTDEDVEIETLVTNVDKGEIWITISAFKILRCTATEPNFWQQNWCLRAMPQLFEGDLAPSP